MFWSRIDGMSNSRATPPPDRSQPPDPPRQRWDVYNDDPAAGSEPDAWCEPSAGWPACPDGKPQELRHPLGFRERNRAELELRVELSGEDGGVCQVGVEERGDEVHVRVLVHLRDEHEHPRPGACRYLDCPVRVWLERPLGDRAVIDADTDEELPLYIPMYRNNVLTPDHGYHVVRRRRRSGRERHR